ncbi:MAG: hypothetical protein ACOC0V_01865 [Oceanicaulis sp.]
MSRTEPSRGAGRVHPAARPFQRFSSQRTGLYVTGAAALILLISFGVEFVMTGGEGWSKYPEVLGGYEVLPGLALAGAILFGWVALRLITVAPDFYERRDMRTKQALPGGTVGRPAPGAPQSGERIEPGTERSAARD